MIELPHKCHPGNEKKCWSNDGDSQDDQSAWVLLSLGMCYEFLLCRCNVIGALNVFGTPFMSLHFIWHHQQPTTLFFLNHDAHQCCITMVTHDHHCPQCSLTTNNDHSMLQHNNNAAMPCHQPNEHQQGQWVKNHLTPPLLTIHVPHHCQWCTNGWW